MPPSVATALTLAGILYLLVRDAYRGESSSPALWFPVLWLGVTGSRFVSQWMNLGAGGGDNYYEGSPLDAFYFATLIAAGTVVLVRRRVEVWPLLKSNGWIACFALYGLLSVTWSDEPLIAGKRWIKTLGHPVMALIILTDRDPIAALRTLAKRIAIILLPLSVLFIKYLPEYGRGFDAFTGKPVNNGVGLTKNDLGYVCMLCGILLTWSLVSSRRTIARSERFYEVVTSCALLLMAFWLLEMSDSATSLATMVIGIATVLALGWGWISRRHFAKLVVIGAVAAWALESSFDVYENVVRLLGRDPSLTDRTLVWNEVLALQKRPWLGYGFESFWLGDRLYTLWEKWWWRPTQAHNGYIETYLNLGIVGLILLGGMLLSTFRRISAQLRIDVDPARVQMAVLLAIILFNYTEAGFRGVGFVWTFFYIIALDVPPHRSTTSTHLKIAS